MQQAMQREKSWRNPAHLMAIKEGFSLPTTPSKSKLPGKRGFCSLTTLLVLFALVAGVAMFNQELGSGSSRTETYYRKALVAKMTFGKDGQTVTATSEEYSHSTVAARAAAAGTKLTSGAKAGGGRASEIQQRAALEVPIDEQKSGDGTLLDLSDTDIDGGEGQEQDPEEGAATAAAGRQKQHQRTADQQEDGQLVTVSSSESDEPLTVTFTTTRGGSQQAQQDGGAMPHADASDVAVNTRSSARAAAIAAAEGAASGSDSAAEAGGTAAAISEMPTAADAGLEGAAATTSQQLAAATAEPVATVDPATPTEAVEVAAQPAATEAAAADGVGVDGAAVEQAAPVEAAEPDLAPGMLVEQWWSDVVDGNGERLLKVPKVERDISASLATAVIFDESLVGELEDCKIAVLDVDKVWGKKMGAGSCDLSDLKTWPFAAPGKGIDGHHMLTAEQFQYSMEHWISQAIRNSSRYTDDLDIADFVFVDMHCYHTSWMAWLHPLNKEGRTLSPNPEEYMRGAISRLRGMPRFRDTKGGDFGMVHPAPLMSGLFSEEAACEDLASVLNMVPERSGLCVWTQNSHAAGRSVLLPYAAVSNVDLEAPVVAASDRETFMFFQGGCGNPDPSVRNLFAAGKMLRWALVEELKALAQPDIHAECACDICEGHMAHDQMMAKMSRSVFCPIMPSNTQSSRRLSEAMLTGCIPVFIGAPFHTLPLSGDIDYKAFALFINVTDSSTWVNRSSPKWEQNHMITKAWKLDDAASAGAMVTVPTLADIVRFLRGMPAEEVAARQAGVIAARLKFYYPAASGAAIAASTVAAGAAGASSSMLGQAAAAAGSNGAVQQQQAAAAGAAAQAAEPAAAPGASVLGELLMRKMCRRAAAVQKRLEEAAQQGVDIADSDEKVEHPTLAIQAAAAVELEQQEAAAAAVAAAGEQPAVAAVPADAAAEDEEDEEVVAQTKKRKKVARQSKKRHLLAATA